MAFDLIIERILELWYLFCYCFVVCYIDSAGRRVESGKESRVDALRLEAAGPPQRTPQLSDRADRSKAPFSQHQEFLCPCDVHTTL